MGLTAKQEKYVQGLVKGLSQREAYKQAYTCKNWLDKSIDEKASVLFKDVKIQSRFNELIDKSNEKVTLTRAKFLNKLEKVFDIAIGELHNDIEIITEEEDEEGNIIQKIKRKKVKSADLKNVATIADRIAKLQGWDKVEEKKAEPIQIVIKKAECKDCENENE